MQHKSIKSQFLSSEIDQIVEDSKSRSCTSSSETEISSPDVIGVDEARSSSSDYSASISSHNSAKKKEIELE